MLLPLHEHICDDFESLPPLAKNFLSVVKVEVDLEKDTRHNMREIYEKISPFYGDDERQVCLVSTPTPSSLTPTDTQPFNGLHRDAC